MARKIMKFNVEKEIREVIVNEIKEVIYISSEDVRTILLEVLEGYGYSIDSISFKTVNHTSKYGDIVPNFQGAVATLYSEEAI